MNPQADFGANLELRQAHEHVQGVGDSPVRGIFQRHDAEIGMAPVHFFEYCGNASHSHELDRLTETLDGRQM
jgi:hypothetical protein